MLHAVDGGRRDRTPAHTDWRVHYPAAESRSRIEPLQRREDAQHAKTNLDWDRHARGAVARLSRFARLVAVAAGFRSGTLHRYQTRNDRYHRRQQIESGQHDKAGFAFFGHYYYSGGPNAGGVYLDAGEGAKRASVNHREHSGSHRLR